MKTFLSNNKMIRRLAATGLGLVFSVAVFAASDLTEAMKERLKPVGQVCMSGDDCAAAPVAAAPSGEPRSGEAVYSTKCFTCHATGAAGAPKYGVPGDWTARLDKGVDTLYTNAISGFNGMPAKGLCMDCSDEEIQAAVDHMVEGSR